mgnify:CR=1 FL=1
MIVVAESGLLATSLNDNTLGDLLGSTYGSIVLTKTVLLAFLIRLGWLQRRRGVDRLPSASVPGTVARIAGIGLPLIAGSDLAASLFDHVIKPGDRIAVIGATPAFLDRLRGRFQSYPWRARWPRSRRQRRSG